MAGVNKCIFIGNLGRDPEVRTGQSGTAVCRLSLGVTERRKEGDGWRDHTEWVRVVCFGKTAENAGQFLQKGRQIYVEGRLQTSKYTDKEGVEKFSTEVVADTVQFLGSRPDGASTTTRRADPGGNPELPGRGSYAAPGFVDDDLPF